MTSSGSRSPRYLEYGVVGRVMSNPFGLDVSLAGSWSVRFSCLDELPKHRQQIGPPEADRAAECRSFETVTRWMAGPQPAPAAVPDRHACAGRDGVEPDFQLRALVGREVGVPPLQHDSSRRLPA